jgi:hypothetical protein
MRKNSDETLRDLERAAKKGDPIARLRLLQERLRRGQVSWRQITIAAGLRDPEALILNPAPLPLDWNNPSVASYAIEQVARESGERRWRRVVTDFACDVAERSIWVYEARYPDDRSLRTVIEASRRAVRPPYVLRPSNAVGLAGRAVDKAEGDREEREFRRPSILRPYYVPAVEAARAVLLAVHTTMDSQRVSSLTPQVGRFGQDDNYRGSVKAYFACRHSALAICSEVSQATSPDLSDQEWRARRFESYQTCYTHEREWQMQRLAHYALGEV